MESRVNSTRPNGLARFFYVCKFVMAFIAGIVFLTYSVFCLYLVLLVAPDEHAVENLYNRGGYSPIILLTLLVILTGVEAVHFGAYASCAAPAMLDGTLFGGRVPRRGCNSVNVYFLVFLSSIMVQMSSFFWFFVYKLCWFDVFDGTLDMDHPPMRRVVLFYCVAILLKGGLLFEMYQFKRRQLPLRRGCRLLPSASAVRVARLAQDNSDADEEQARTPASSSNVNQTVRVESDETTPLRRRSVATRVREVAEALERCLEPEGVNAEVGGERDTAAEDYFVQPLSLSSRPRDGE